MATPKNTICLWFDKDAEEAAEFYASVFPDSRVDAVHRAPGDFPGGKEGDVLTVQFTVCGIPCMGLNGGPGVSRADTARVLGLELARQQDREERAVAKLRHPCTPGDLTHLKKL